jgi:hypothetical protein
MRTASALKALAQITTSQWGLVTTAQASSKGVTKLDISRLANAGHLERVVQGVYRDLGAPSSMFDEVRAYWLAARPELLAEQRLMNLEQDFIATGSTAAWLLGIGDLIPQKFEFVAAARKQTARKVVQFRLAKVELGEIEFAEGLPVLKPLATVIELLRERTDLTLVARVLSDAQGSIYDMTNFSKSIAGFSASYGLGRNDGDALAAKLHRLAGQDAESIGQKLAELKKQVAFNQELLASQQAEERRSRRDVELNA